MISFAKRMGVTATALIAPFLISTPSYAESVNTTGLVNQQAVSDFSQSLRMTLDVHSLLEQGDVSQAKVKLDKALSKMQTALRKDATLGVGSVQGQTLHSDLKTVRTNLNVSDRFEAQSALTALINSAGLQATT